MSGWRLGGLAVALWGATGCTYALHMTSTPVTAVVELPDGSTVVTPTTVKVKVAPFGKQEVKVTASGYRDLVVDLRRTEASLPRWFGDLLFHPAAVVGVEPRGEITWVLVEEHDPVQ